VLLKNFYQFKIEKHEDEKINAFIEFNKEHDIFKGHFPEKPIVPGVTQILIVKEILKKCLNLDLQLVSSKSIKHMSMISPDDITKLNVEILYKKVENNYKVNAILYKGEKKFLKLIGIYCERK